MGLITPEGAGLSHPIAPRWLDLDGVRAKVGEQLRREGPGTLGEVRRFGRQYYLGVNYQF